MDTTGQKFQNIHIYSAFIKMKTDQFLNNLKCCKLVNLQFPAASEENKAL